jgi:uncharacterized membrane protein YcaP (DUF421 family)
MHEIENFLIGSSSWSFLLEVAYRSVIIYALLLLSMRIMGKRMAAQLEIAELAVILVLGAAISAPMQVATQGILPALVVLGTVAGLQRALSVMAFKSLWFQKTANGQVNMLVCDGHFVLDRMHANHLSRDMLLSELRARGVRQLGQVHRLYIEATGTLSIIYFKEAKAGLSLSPDYQDSAWFGWQSDASCVCWNCGYLIDRDQAAATCPNCGNHRRCLAVK